MKTISAWQGDTIPLSVERPDDTATSATLLVGVVGEPAVFTKTVTFESDLADLTITDEENIESSIPAGSHNYLVRVDYSDGSEITFPQPDTTPPEQLPVFIIKKRIEG